DEIDRALKSAALKPKLYSTLWNKYGGKLPSNDSLQYELIRGGNFNRDSVSGFIKDFRATVDFAKLGEGDRLGGSEGQGDGNSGHIEPPPPPPPGTKKMPEVGSAATTEAYDLTLPLISGDQAILRIPRRLTKEDYTLLIT